MEIEARVKVQDLVIVKKKLQEMGAMFSKTVKVQKDSIFKRWGEERAAQKPGSFILRIREQGEKTFLTYKALTTTVGSWREYETEVSSAPMMVKILGEIGFVSVLEMNKSRLQGKLGEITLCLDTIKELGTFLEVEVICDDVKNGKKNLLILLEKLGFAENEIIHEGYAAMLFKQQGIVYENTG
ncbi:class IV adenylate cyclase [Candidatus Woesearchaeota archaeon]|nr:class IV adenylate cyclase [Candidatus Woesearchaeota archaeon]